MSYQGNTFREAIDPLETIILLASVPTTIAGGIVSSWLYEKLKGRNVDRIEIDRTIVEFDEGEKIRRIIHEKIRKNTDIPT